MTMADFEAHLNGSKTMGHYMMNENDECKLFAFDIDLLDFQRFDGPHEGCDAATIIGEPDKIHKHPWMVRQEDGSFVGYNLREEWLKGEASPFHERLTIQLRCMAEGLALRINRTLNISVAISNSGGKGLHVYAFTGLMPGEVLRNLALEILDGFGFVPTKGANFFQQPHDYKALEVEIFPKQASLQGKDLGNLMKLPLGVNRKTGIRSEFITCRVGYNGLQAMDPIHALEGDLPWE
jgi:hypothetical protein